jgi:hypothetical protein
LDEFTERIYAAKCMYEFLLEGGAIMNGMILAVAVFTVCLHFRFGFVSIWRTRRRE